MKKQSLLLLVVSCLFALPSFAQLGRIFTSDDLLSNSLINDIAQDRKGLVWIATQDGLNVYDGHRMIVYHKNDGSQLADNRATCLFVAADGTVYVGTGRGAQRFDSRTKTFVTLEPRNPSVPHNAYINHISSLRSGDILFSTSGRGVLVLKKGDSRLEELRQPGGIFVRDVTEDSRGRLWVASQNGGLYLFGKAGQQEQAFLTDGQQGMVLRVVEDHLGHIYAATMNNGLYRYENAVGGGKGQFVHVASTAGLQISTILFTRMHAGAGTDDERLLLGSDGAGLKLFDPQTQTLTDNPIVTNEIDLKKGKVHSVMYDRDGNLWLGLYQKGVYMQPRTTGGFDYIGHKSATHNSIGSCCVMALYCDRQGTIWVGTDNDGIYRLSQQGELLAHYPQPATVMSITGDDSGRIWVGTYTQGCGTITADGSYHRLALPKDIVPAVFSLACDSRHRLWMATLGSGLVCYHLLTGEVENMRTPPDTESQPDDNIMPNNYALCITPSRDGRKLWISTSDGLVCYDLEQRSFVSQFGGNRVLKGRSLTQVFEASDGTLWLGSIEGVCHLNAKGEQLHIYTTVDGLPNNTIRSLCSDGQGHLWIGTNHGLSRFDIATATFSNYSTGNGLQGNEFTDRAAVNVGDTLMVFGGTNGISLFRPSQIHTEQRHLQVKLTALSTGEQEVVGGMKSGIYTICDSAVIDAEEFDLAYENNSFTLHFSAMDYANSDQIVYEYRINGSEWVSMAAGQSALNFSRLAAGTYDFAVRARSGETLSDELTFVITVHPAWYASWWFRLLLLLLAGLLLLAYFRYRRRQEQTRLRIQEHIHAEELSEAKLRFFMNISHEIRTPMTLIIAPLLSLMKQETDPQRKGVYATIRRNAERILGLINQMMDLRKIDKGQMQLHMAETDLVTFIDDLYGLFSHQARAKRIALRFEHDEAALPVWIDRKHFDKVIVNLLSNALKFTPIGGEIVIRLSRSDHPASVQISISDNGEKIPEDKLEKIFERFYQASSVTNERTAGTGIGLDLTRSLVELHHGTITAHNLDEGCEFVVTLPLGNSHLRADEMEPDIQTDAANDPFEVLSTGDTAVEASADDIDQALVQLQGDNSGGRERVVIAEDDDEIRAYLTSELGGDYDVTACVNGREALAAVLRLQPAVVITDVMMPEMDGNALCSQLKSNAQTNDIPIIMLTAKSRDEDRLESLETGADAYIVKPFNMDILRRTVVNLVGHQQLLRMKYGRIEGLEQQIDEVQVKTADEKLLERIMASINRHLDDSDLNIDMLSEEAGISRVHLHRKMKELTGQTPHDFIRSIRLKRAARLLATQGMSVTEVMYACGFASIASFSTVFKRFYGMTPTEYMKASREKGAEA